MLSPEVGRLTRCRPGQRPLEAPGERPSRLPEAPASLGWWLPVRPPTLTLLSRQRDPVVTLGPWTIQDPVPVSSPLITSAESTLPSEVTFTGARCRDGGTRCGALFSPPHHVMGSGWAGRVLARSPLSEALSQCPVGVPHGTPAGRPPAQGSRSGFLRKREARASSCGGTEVTVPLRGTG